MARRTPIVHDLDETIALMVKLVRKRHPAELRSPRRLRVLRETAIAGFRRRLPLKVGRPRSRFLNRVESIMRKGKSLSQTLREIVPDFGKMSSYERERVKQNVRTALRKRRKARQK
jgi:hypothetical protein